LSLLFLALCSAPALAQDFETFNLSGSALDGGGALQVAQPWLRGPGSMYAGLAVSYAKDPIVAVSAADGERQPLIGSQLGLRLGGGYAVHERVRIDLELPIFPSIRLDDVALSDFNQIGLTDGLSTVGSLGNPRLSALVSVWGTETLALGVVPVVEIPLASQSAYLSNGFAGGLTATFGVKAGAAKVYSEVGVLASGANAFADINVGTKFPYGVGGNYALAPGAIVGAEINGAYDVGGGYKGVKHPMEGHVFVDGHLGDSGVHLMGGAGSALIGSLGSPQFRLFFGFGYAGGGGQNPAPDTGETVRPNANLPPDLPPDTDGDGIPDPVDQCPEGREDRDKFADEDGCPDPDNDQDGVLDQLDQCPLEGEDLDGHQDEDGCPELDNDGDSVPDTEDGCPMLAGAPELGGCPDRDGDGLLDPDDQCPDEPGGFPTMGCPE
jgi:hypothetical protein